MKELSKSSADFVPDFRSGVAALWMLAFVAFLPALRAGFIWDDGPALTENPLLRLPGGLWLIWTTHGRIPNESHFWPMIYTFYWIETRLWGYAPLGFHLVNVALNAADAIFLFLLLRGWRIPGAWPAAALFALHPVHVESVAWIHEFKDLLSAFFYLAAFSLFARFEGDDARRPWRLAGALALLALGMLSKSVVVTFPAGAAIWIWYRRGTLPRRDWIPLLLLFGGAAAFALFDLTMVHRIEHADFGYSPVQRLLLASRALAFYFGKLVWPFHLNIIYRHWTVDPARAFDWIFPAGFAGLFGILFLLRRRIGRGPLACMLFYAATLAPMLGLVDFAFLEIAPVADRFQYLASIGPCILVGAAVRRWLLADSGPRAAGRAAFAILLLALGTLTWRQAAVYRDLRTLFEAAVDRNPDSPHAHANLGAAFSESGRLDAAREQFRIALAIKPDYMLARSNLGAVLAKQGDIAGAVREYRSIAEHDPDWLGPVNDLAWYLATSDDPAIRNPAESLKWAKIAASKSSSRDPAILDTLSAAQFAAGLYGEASQTAGHALLLARAAGDSELASQIQVRLDTYRHATRRGGPLDSRAAH